MFIGEHSSSSAPVIHPAETTTTPVNIELLTATARSQFQPGNIPKPLQDLAQWTGWRYADKGNGKPTKPPINARTGGNASTNNPATWSTFEAALAAFNADSTLAGLNLVLTPDDPIVAIDIDDYTGNDPAALSWFTGTYAERSPSGGFHIFAIGQCPAGAKKNGQYEVKRSLTVTGQRIAGHASGLTAQQPAIDRYHRECLTKPTITRKNDPVPPADFSFVNVGSGSVDYEKRLNLALGNAEIRALYAGDSAGYPSRSEAEEALIIRLLRFTDHGETDVVADWLNRSGCTKWLERDKDSDVYRRNTLAAAVKHWDGKTFEDKWESARQHGAELSAALLKNREPGSDDEPTPDAAGTAPGFTFCDLRQLRSAALQPPAFIVNPLIPRGHLTLFGGHGGSGKTTVAFVLAAHVACGADWSGLPVTAGKVLIASFEDGQELVLWRLKNIVEEYGLDFDAIENNLTVIDATQSDAIMSEANNGGIRNVISTADGQALIDHIRQQQYDLVIIDNASDAFDGDENHRRQVRRFVRICANSVSAHNGAIVLLAHIDKSAARYGASGNSYSGSTGWHNSARSRLALIDNELRQEKLNVGKVLENPIPIVWTDRAVPIPADSDGAQLAQSLKDGEDDKALLACFVAANEAGTTVVAADTGPVTTWHKLSVYPELPKHLKEDRQRFRETVARLVRSGKLRRESYETPNRKRGERLVIPD